MTLNAMTQSQKPTISYHVANTESDRIVVYQLRYKVFTEEFNDHRYALPKIKEYKDKFDHENALIIYAKTRTNVIGTLRGIFRHNGGFYDEEHGLLELANLLQQPLEWIIENTIFFTRGAIHPEYRGANIFHHLNRKLENHAIEKNMKVIIVTVAPNNTKLINWYKHHDYIQYGFGHNSKNGWNGVNLYKLL